VLPQPRTSPQGTDLIAGGNATGKDNEMIRRPCKGLRNACFNFAGESQNRRPDPDRTLPSFGFDLAMA
jgi:hypothetical protein